MLEREQELGMVRDRERQFCGIIPAFARSRKMRETPTKIRCLRDPAPIDH